MKISQSNNGIVFLVGAGPGDPELITLRAINCLKKADMVIHDRLVNRSLLRYAPDAQWIDVGKQPNHHPVPQDKINALLVEHAQAGKCVVRLKGGDPFVFGRGGEEALVLFEAGISFEIVPGITSGIAATAYAGIPVTQRGIATSVAFITGHESDESNTSDFSLRADVCGADTLVFYMGVKNLPRIVEQLLALGRSPETPVALIERGTMPAQKVVTGTLQDILLKSSSVRPPTITVVGYTVQYRENLHWFEAQQTRPLLGLRILNTRPIQSEDRLNLNDQLAGLGAEVHYVPAIQLTASPESSEIDRAIGEILHRSIQQHPYDWIVFTSANAVDVFMQRLMKQGGDSRALFGSRLAVIGETTSASLSKYGLCADFCPAEATGECLANNLPNASASRILLPLSAAALPAASSILQKRGAFVDAITCYTPQASQKNEELFNRLKSKEIDAVLFFSPSAIEGLKDMLGSASLKEALDGVTIACVGSTTAAAAQHCGLEVAIAAQKHTAQGLVEALCDWRTGANSLQTK